MVRSLLDRWDDVIAYSPGPLVVTSRGGEGRFEIRDCREYIQRNIYFLGYHEFRETRLVRELLHAGDTFVDVGANLGWFTVLGAACVGAAGRVFAFEPSPQLHDHLLVNLRLNGFDNVTAERLALADRSGRALLSRASPRNAGTASLLKGPVRDPLATEVPVTALDEYRSRIGIGAIRLMKIDVEGAEMDVLIGARKTLADRVCDFVLIEVVEEHLRRRGLTCSDLLGLLRDSGYRLFQIGLFGRRQIDRCERVRSANILAQAER